MTGGGTDITAAIARHLLSYVRRAAGDAAARQVAAAARLSLDDEGLGPRQDWITAEELAVLADAAASVTGDPEIGRRLGEELFRADEVGPHADFLVGAGDPGAALVVAVAHTPRLVSVRRYDVVERSDEHAVVESRALHPAAAHRVHCQMLAGHWARIPGLFGVVGAVTEPLCTARGDDRCRLVVRWERPAPVAEDRRIRSRRRVDELVGRFEAMQAMAAELATIDDLGVALERIIDRAGAAMLASRFLVTVRPHADATPSVFSAHLEAETAERAAESLWALGPARVAVDGLAGLGTPVVADIASGGRHFGYLAAFLPPDTVVRDVDERLLGAYAGHAAATIERVVAAEEARVQHRAATALLELSHSLAGARSIPEITELVTTAVDDITGGDVSGVWLLDEEAGCYRLQAIRESSGLPGPRVLRIDNLADISRLEADPVPFVLRRATAGAAVAQVLDGWQVEECQVAPIVHRGRLHGLLATGSRRALSDFEGRGVLEAVSALAHHAGTAIDNTLLLQQVRHQALHDSLTGLPNRLQIEERARLALRNARRDGTAVGIAFVDLDRFKNVNDTLGHVAGDDLIGLVAERLGRHVRPSDVVARLGGDEFLLLLPDLDAAARAEDVVQRVLDALRAPFSVDGEALYVSASVGIACYPDHGDDYGTLLARADAAMYAAKAGGRNRYAVHDGATAARRSKLKIESELHRAVERGELRLHFQPQVELRTGAIVAAEALVRWQHPTLGLIGPSTFVAVAEESGLIVDVDRWVRRAALAQAAAWQHGGTPLRVSVNASRHDLAGPGLVADVAALLDELDLDPELVELEITDRIVMSDEDLPSSVAGLRELGVRLAVDDFGTGSSVLSRLHHCPVDVLKIDRTFIEPFSYPDPDTRLVDGLVSMARALDLEVVIEGVEDAAQAAAVRRVGPELAQGFHYHRPMPAEELTALLDAQAARTPAPPEAAPIRRRSGRRARR